MDKIIMKDMAFYGYHGVLEEENKLGQRFIITVELYADLKNAGLTDNIENTISYAEVYETVKSFFEGKIYKLLEALAESIASEILNKYSLVSEVLVGIKKPDAPVKGIFGYFGVEIRRKRND